MSFFYRGIQQSQYKTALLSYFRTIQVHNTYYNTTTLPKKCTKGVNELSKYLIQILRFRLVCYFCSEPMIPRLLTALFFCLSTIYAGAQSALGVPHITNYSVLDYKGGTQNWDIQQDKSGILYFANNEGLLTFNGYYWKLYPLPNKTIVRSVKLAEDGKVYVGGQDELGYFFPDKSGVLRFTSLKPLIPAAARQFSDVWDIVIYKSQVFFRTIDKVFQLKDGRISVFRTENSWAFLGLGKDRLYVQDVKKGLMLFNNGSLSASCTDPRLKDMTVSSILPYKGDTLMVFTLKHGLFLLHDSVLIKKHSSAEPIFRDARIFRAIEINQDLYALGTTSAAVCIIDKRGELLERFSSDNGLQKNNIRSLFVDQDKNLWLGLDDGIDYVAYNSAIKTIYPDKAKQVTTYSTLIYDKKLYVGTSNGVHFSPIDLIKGDLSYSKAMFSEVKNTAGQVWGLSEVNGKLLMGHEDGVAVLSHDSSQPVYQAPGTWLFQPLSSVYPSSDIIAGTYSGLQAISYSSGEFFNRGHIEGVTEPLRFLTYDQDEQNLWASHPYRGVYRFSLSADRRSIEKSRLYTQKDGLPLNLYNYVFKIKNRIVVATAKGICEFDAAKNRFAASSFFYPIFKTMSVEFLREDTEGNVWFVTSKKVGVVDFSRKSGKDNFTIIYFPELTGKTVAGFENIYPYNKNNIFIGSNKGVFHINYEKYARKIDRPNVLLGLVKLTGKKDSTIFGGYFIDGNSIAKTQAKRNVQSLSYKHNSLHFEFASSLFEHRDNIEYSFQLAGFDKEWSDWSSKTEKDYTNLPPGTYTFSVKARNNLGSESDPVSYSFQISRAWYQSYWIYSLYIIVLGGIIYLLIKRQQKKHEDEQRRLKYLHQLELERNEKKIVTLQNEKLEADVSYKNKELATITMHLVQRGKLLSKIKEELQPVLLEDNRESHPEHLKRVLRLLDESEKRDQDWQQFSIHFDRVHSNFLSVLKERFPQLSPNDLKLCAYLKMNLSTKEMAQLMNITIRAVEVSRYRLRKKLNIGSDVNLFDFLMQNTASQTLHS